MLMANEIPKRNSDSWSIAGRRSKMTLRCHFSTASLRLWRRITRSSSVPWPKRVVLKWPSHCFPRTAPKAVRRLKDRLIYPKDWAHMTNEPGPDFKSCEMMIAGSIGKDWFPKLFWTKRERSKLVVLVRLGCRSAFMSTMNAELTAEKRPAYEDMYKILRKVETVHITYENKLYV